MKKIIIPVIIILLGIIFYTPPKDNVSVPDVVFYEVNITGEVIKPGVYKVPENTTYSTAVSMAGVTKRSVFIDNDDVISKNVSINVLKREKSININTATKSELMSIPSIGEKKAISIMKYRATKKIETYIELKKVLKISNNEALLKVMSYTVLK